VPDEGEREPLTREPVDEAEVAEAEAFIRTRYTDRFSSPVREKDAVLPEKVTAGTAEVTSSADVSVVDSSSGVSPADADAADPVSAIPFVHPQRSAPAQSSRIAPERRRK
jgi:hypothetical protein